MKLPPRGQRQPDGRIKIAVSFHRKTFVALCLRAAKYDLSFSETVDDCALCGLLDIEDSEQHDLQQQETSHDNQTV